MRVRHKASHSVQPSGLLQINRADPGSQGIISSFVFKRGNIDPQRDLVSGISSPIVGSITQGVGPSGSVVTINGTGVNYLNVPKAAIPGFPSNASNIVVFPWAIEVFGRPNNVGSFAYPMGCLAGGTGVDWFGLDASGGFWNGYDRAINKKATGNVTVPSTSRYDHLFYVAEKSNLKKIYVNGVLEGTDTNDNVNTTTLTRLFFGFDSVSGNGFNATYEFGNLYNTLVTAAQVMERYQNRYGFVQPLRRKHYVGVAAALFVPEEDGMTFTTVWRNG